MNPTNKLVNAIAKLSADTDTVAGQFYGTVTSVNPLEITRESGSSAVPITEKFLVLPRSCKQYVTEHVTHWQPSGKSPDESPNIGDHNHKIEIEHWTDLKLDEKVVLFSFNKGQSYLVERI